MSLLDLARRHLPGGARRRSAAERPGVERIDDEVVQLEMGDPYPRDYDTGSARHLTNRLVPLLATALGLSLAINVLQSVAVIQILPLKKLVPVFVGLTPRSEQVVEFAPLETGGDPLREITRALVQRWLIHRDEIVPDLEFQKNQVQWIARRSSPEVTRAFEAAASRQFKEAIQRGFTRTVQLDVSSVTEQFSGTWIANFTLTDTETGRPQPTVSKWQARVRIEYAGQRMLREELNTQSIEDLVVNTTGFRVVYFERSQL